MPNRTRKRLKIEDFSRTGTAKKFGLVLESDPDPSNDLSSSKTGPGTARKLESVLEMEPEPLEI